MCARLLPSSALWSCLAAIVLVDLLAMAVGGFRLAGHGAAVIVAVCAGAWGLGYFYSAARPDVRIAALAFSAAYLIAYTFAAAVLSYLGTSLNLPLLDAHFARADRALGLDWLALLEYTNSHPMLATLYAAPTTRACCSWWPCSSCLRPPAGWRGSPISWRCSRSPAW